MKNYVQHGHTVSFTAPAGGVIGGLGYLIGALFGVALFSAEAGAPFESRLEGVHQLPKAVGAIGEGVKLYWDNAAKNVTTTAAGNTFIGHAAKAEVAGAATVNVRLQPAA